MFHKTSLKLSALYLGIIMVISFSFSLNLYHLLTQEIDRGFRRQTALVDNLPRFDGFTNVRDQFISQRQSEYKSAHDHIVSRLILTNLLILISGGFLSYYLARRTLMPIEESHNAQSRFTADASHELRTPLAVMTTENEVTLMKKNITLIQAKNQIKSNLEELQKLTALTDGLLKLSQLKNDSIGTEKISLEHVVDQTLLRVLSFAESKNILVNTNIKSNLLVTGDETSLIEAFVTIVDNAIKYSHQKSEIKITAITDKKYVTVKITDQGIGISNLDQEHIFERFYRADQARNKQNVGGYGLGLAIAKNIIELHGGSINVVSTPKKGSTFNVRLPHYLKSKTI